MKKLAVITGAASGIGLALAKACLADDMHVVMVDIAESVLHEQVNQLNEFSPVKAIARVCDVSNEDEVLQLAQDIFARFKRVDLLINNAGIMGALAPVWELSSKQVRNVLDVNLYGVLYGIQAFLPFMLEQMHPAHIINMASFYGLCSGSQMAPYAMSKHAILALTESLYFDLRRLNKPIDVSVVCPSFTDTPLLINSAADNDASLHRKVGDLMARSRPAEEVAECIIREMKKKTFYILPDAEVKNYCEQRTKAVIEQSMPYEHGFEKILTSLSRRDGKTALDKKNKL